MNDRAERKPKEASGNAIALLGPRLPYFPEPCTVKGIDVHTWQVLTDVIWPTAASVHGVMLAWDYCKSRKLDPLKRTVHVVPIWDKTRGMMVDSVWPGIAELRTTATRTSEYAGCDAAEFGPDIEQTFVSDETDERTGEIRQRTLKVKFPEWAQMTVYRVVRDQVRKFPGPRVYWLETYATAGRNTDLPNEMWRDRPRGQLEKCAEAAALRRAFPEELGGDYIGDEIGHQIDPTGAIDGKYSVVRESEPPGEAKKTAATTAERPTRESVKKDAEKPKAEEKQPAGDKTVKEPEKPKETAVSQASKKPKDPPKDEPKQAELLNEPAKTEPPKEAQKETVPPAFDDWLRDQYKALDKTTSVSALDDLQERVEHELRDEDAERKKWVAECNAKARALMAANKKK